MSIPDTLESVAVGRRGCMFTSILSSAGDGVVTCADGQYVDQRVSAEPGSSTMVDPSPYVDAFG
ncbi:hypothetical protein GCM10017653_36240 [Ancylobacter defluvii]|uniref:Uncharacterized protein n=1 Tax=Ancylobacter defluvii TaxID=1282440 RepID=A0A9W6NBI1_9HYPH|nr:hypothetical protein GCM10017653_36240 [Ancylobacter defluvii]